MGFHSRAKRYLPKNPVTIALMDEDVPVAFGVAKNISESGACVIINAPLTPGRDYRFKMSFYRAGILAARGRVVWSAEPKSSEAYAAASGMELQISSATERQRLRDILKSPEFSMAAD